MTYNPRPELRLEQQVQDYLDERHRILSVTGPTKTGKTTLLKSILADAIWLAGGSIRSLSDFWDQTADCLGLYSGLEVQEVLNSEESLSVGVSGGAPGILQGSATGAYRTGQSGSTKFSQARPVSALTRKHLAERNSLVVIDDFHYILPEIQGDIVRAIKDLVFQGVGFVVVAVPHRSYDVMRVEKEMTGRVQQLGVGFWSESELEAIAAAGFKALNVVDEQSKLAERLAEESFGSPHLMQDFCLELCKNNGFRQSQRIPLHLVAPDWSTFFSSRANQASRIAFEHLARGPRQRSDRKRRKLTNGNDVDIYGAILAAIAHTGPKVKITYEEVRSGLREVLESELPQRHEVKRVLQEMTKIAKSDLIPGEPVVDYDDEMESLYISDPFFAYYLRWGTLDV